MIKKYRLTTVILQCAICCFLRKHNNVYNHWNIKHILFLFMIRIENPHKRRNNNWKFVWTFLNLYFKYKVNMYFILETTSKQYGIHYLLGQVFLAGEKSFFVLKNAFRIFLIFYFYFNTLFLSSLFDYKYILSSDNPSHRSKTRWFRYLLKY